MAATNTINPAMSSEMRARLYNIFDVQAGQLLQRVKPL
jgi:hypothetical protein